MNTEKLKHIDKLLKHMLFLVLNNAPTKRELLSNRHYRKNDRVSLAHRRQCFTWALEMELIYKATKFGIFNAKYQLSLKGKKYLTQ